MNGRKWWTQWLCKYVEPGVGGSEHAHDLGTGRAQGACS